MKKIYNIISAVLIVIIVTVSAILYYKSDREGPEIKFPEKEITYTQGESQKILLNGVKAIDSRDGDVSDTLIVENIVPLSNGTTARVTYAAQDRDSHITKKSLIVNYVAARNEKKETQSKSRNKQDKNADNDMTTKDPENTENTSTKISPTIKPTEPKENKSKENPVIKLSTKEVTLIKGSLFEPLKLVKEIKDNKDDKNDIYTRIHIDGYYNLKVPGIYFIQYYVIDSDRNISSPVYLKLIVTE